MARTHRVLATVLALAIHASAGLAPPPSPFSPALVERVFVDPPVIEFPTAPIILAPLRRVRRGNTKRDRKSALELKAEEIFDWLGADGTIAELKVQTPGQDENIVNLELIDDMVQKVECPVGGTGNLTIQFAQAADFDDAEDVWKWVNKSPANHFIMVVGVGSCGNAERIVYDVSGLGYADKSETAVLQVRETTWKEAAHTFDLTVGKVDAPAAKHLLRARGRRGIFDGLKDVVDKAVDAVKEIPDKVNEVVDEVKKVPAKIVDEVKKVPEKVEDVVKAIPSQVANLVGDIPDQIGDVVAAIPVQAGDVIDDLINPGIKPDFTIGFDNDFPDKTISFSTNNLTVSAVCKECFTKGSFDVKGKFRVELLETKEAWIELSTDGITAKAVIGLALKGALTGKLAQKTVPIAKFSPAGISIPGVLTIGPTISVNMGVELSEITASVNINVGGSATIPKSSARLDFLNKDKTKATGWKPSFKAEPFKVDGNVEAKASAFIQPAIGLEISVVETGFTAEISANTPILTASMKAIACKLTPLCSW